jgi:hypothetical protein
MKKRYGLKYTMVSITLVDKKNKGDAETLVRILSDSFGDEFETMRKEYIKSLANESCIYFVKLKGETVGTFELKNKSELATFGVLTKYQRKGIAGREYNMRNQIYNHSTFVGVARESNQR